MNLRLNKTLNLFTLILKHYSFCALFITYFIVFIFVIKNFSIKISNDYIIVLCFSIMVAIPLLSKFDIVEFKGIIFKKSISDDIVQATQKEIEETKKETNADVDLSKIDELTDKSKSHSNSSADLQRRIQERKNIEIKVLERFSNYRHFRKEVKLELDEKDPVANFNSLVFDATYKNRKKTYFILILNASALFFVNRDRIYRYLRVIKDVSDRKYHGKIILKLLVIDNEDKTKQIQGSRINIFKNWFSVAIDSGYLDLVILDKAGDTLEDD